jgi:hypothetical protein
LCKRLLSFSASGLQSGDDFIFVGEVWFRCVELEEVNVEHPGQVGDSYAYKLEVNEIAQGSQMA